MLSLSLAFLWYLQLRRPGRGRVTSWGAQADWFRSCNYAGMRYGLPLYWAPTGSVAWISTDIPLHHIPIYQEFRYNMNCQSFQNTKSQLLIWFRVQSSGKTEPARQQNAQKQRPTQHGFFPSEAQFSPEDDCSQCKAASQVSFTKSVLHVCFV